MGWMRFVPLIALAGCATQPVPFAIEHTGALSTADYAALDRQAAGATPVVKAREGHSAPSPEPYFVYSFKPGFNPRGATLQIGAIGGPPGKTAEVAADMPAQLMAKIADARAFASVTLQPTSGAYVLNGTITRVAEQGNRAGTQFEATVTHDGVVVGVIQVNVLQMQPDFGALAFTALLSAAQGSRASFVSQRVRDIFEQVVAGRLDGIDTESFSGLYLYPSSSQ